MIYIKIGVKKLEKLDRIVGLDDEREEGRGREAGRGRREESQEEKQKEVVLEKKGVNDNDNVRQKE